MRRSLCRPRSGIWRRRFDASPARRRRRRSTAPSAWRRCKRKRKEPAPRRAPTRVIVRPVLPYRLDRRPIRAPTISGSRANAVRQCVSWLATEYRPSGTVVVPTCAAGGSAADGPNQLPSCVVLQERHRRTYHVKSLRRCGCRHADCAARPRHAAAPFETRRALPRRTQRGPVQRRHAIAGIAIGAGPLWVRPALLWAAPLCVRPAAILPAILRARTVRPVRRGAIRIKSGNAWCVINLVNE